MGIFLTGSREPSHHLDDGEVPSFFEIADLRPPSALEGKVKFIGHVTNQCLSITSSRTSTTKPSYLNKSIPLLAHPSLTAPHVITPTTPTTPTPKTLSNTLPCQLTSRTTSEYL